MLAPQADRRRLPRAITSRVAAGNLGTGGGEIAAGATEVTLTVAADGGSRVRLVTTADGGTPRYSNTVFVVDPVRVTRRPGITRTQSSTGPEARNLFDDPRLAEKFLWTLTLSGQISHCDNPTPPRRELAMMQLELTSRTISIAGKTISMNVPAGSGIHCSDSLWEFPRSHPEVEEPSRRPFLSAGPTKWSPTRKPGSRATESRHGRSR